MRALRPLAKTGTKGAEFRHFARQAAPGRYPAPAPELQAESV